VSENSLIDHFNSDLLEIAKEMNKHLKTETIQDIRKFYQYRNIDEIREIVYELLSGKHTFDGRSFIESSNNKISELAFNLLGLDDNESIVFDLGSGTGNFLANVYTNAQAKHLNLKGLIGLELNLDQAHISQMALDLLVDDSIKPVVVIGNALDKPGNQYTKGYVFPPFGIRQIIQEKTVKSHLFPDIKLTNRNTTEWFFIDSLLSGLQSNGRAIALVTGRALFNDADKEFRNRLIKEGKLEGIIELPNNVLSFTAIKIYVLVFSGGNTKVKFVDASDAINSDARKFRKFELPVDPIIEFYQNEIVKCINNDKLIDLPNLTPSNILLDTMKPKEGVPLKEITEIITGSQYTLNKFEDICTNDLTGYKILTSGDIEDGAVDWDNLQSIDYKGNKFDKFAIKKHDVIVTSKSSKVKTAVVDIEPKEKILVTGGMLIIRPNIRKIDPTYLKMFLDSEQGQNALKAIGKGITIITINAKDLSNIAVPLISLKKQKMKSEKYNNFLSSLLAYKEQMKKIEIILKNSFLDEGEE